jgi:hypothetical protein
MRRLRNRSGLRVFSSCDCDCVCYCCDIAVVACSRSRSHRDQTHRFCGMARSIYSARTTSGLGG